MCEVSTTLSSSRSACGTFGSFSNTSSAAPAMVPACSASISAASSITEPRATLITQPWGPSALNTSAFTSLRVPAPPGVISTRKSLCAASSAGLAT